MKNIRGFVSENFQFFEVKFSIYLNRLVFVMSYSNTVYGKVCIEVTNSLVLGQSPFPT